MLAGTGPINPGPSEFTSRQLAEKVIHLTGSRWIIASAPLPEDDPLQRQLVTAQAKHLLGWQPTFPLGVGLPRTIPYFQALLREAPASAPSREQTDAQ